MSGILAGQVWLSDLTADLKPIAATLADIGNDDGTSIFPTYAYIAWRMGRSERQVQRWMDALVRMGLLVLIAPSGHRRAAEYRLVVEALPARARWKGPIGGQARAEKRRRKGDMVSPMTDPAMGDRVSPIPDRGKGDTMSPLADSAKGDIRDGSRVTSTTGMGDIHDSSWVTSTTESAPASLNDPSDDPSDDPLRETRDADAPRSLSLLPNPDQRARLRVEFDRLCAVYPRVEKTKRCWRLFFRLQPSEAVVESMLAMVEHQKRTVWGGLKPRYIPGLLTYLTDEQWTDEVSDVAPYSAEELAEARRLMGSLYLGRCPHGPPCASSDACLKAIAERQRRRARE